MYDDGPAGRGRDSDESPQERINRVRNQYRTTYGRAGDIDPKYNPDLGQRGATNIVRSKLGTPEAVDSIEIGPKALRGSDEDLGTVLRHEYDHANRAMSDTHPFDMSSNPTIVDPRTGLTATDLAFEAYLKVQDAKFAASIGDWSQYEYRMQQASNALAIIQRYVGGL